MLHCRLPPPSTHAVWELLPSETTALIILHPCVLEHHTQPRPEPVICIHPQQQPQLCSLYEHTRTPCTTNCRAYVCVQTYAHVGVHSSRRACAPACERSSLRASIHMLTHPHTHTHTHTHAQPYICAQPRAHRHGHRHGHIHRHRHKKEYTHACKRKHANSAHVRKHRDVSDVLYKQDVLARMYTHMHTSAYTHMQTHVCV